MFPAGIQFVELLIDLFCLYIRFDLLCFGFLPGCPFHFSLLHLLTVSGCQILQMLQQVFIPCQPPAFRVFLRVLRPDKGLFHQESNPVYGVSPLLAQLFRRQRKNLFIPFVLGVIVQSAENVRFFRAARAEKLFEFPLRKHDDLAELCLVHTDDLRDSCGDLRRAVHDRCIRLIKPGIDPGIVVFILSPYFCKLDRTLDGIFLPLVGERKGYCTVR